MKRPETFGKKQRARYLVVEKGCTYKEAAEAVGVSPNTLTAWATEHNWEKAIEEKIGKALIFSDFLDENQMPEHLKGHEMAVKRFLAAYMVTVVGLEQKEAAKRLNVSENTLSQWSKAGGWKMQRKAALKMKASSSNGERFTTIKKRTYGLENGLYDYLQKVYPSVLPTVKRAWVEYIIYQQARVTSLVNVWRDEQAASGNRSVCEETPPVSTGGSFSNKK